MIINNGCTINRVDRHFAINSIFVYHLLVILFKNIKKDTTHVL